MARLDECTWSVNWDSTETVDGKHILGTQLGPDENGRIWPSRREQAAVAQ
jgi:hypothetical protein